MTSPRTRRRGLTLIELLIVIAVIGALAALAATAAFRAASGSKKQATDGTVTKLYSLVQAKWKRIVDQCIDDVEKGWEPPAVAAFCGGSSSLRYKEKAKAVWTYLRLKNEFPTTPTEAVADIQLNSTLVVQRSGAFAEMANPKGTTTPDNSYLVTDGSDDGPYHMSAACLYLSLANESLEGLEGQTAPLPGGKFRCFRDGWGQPIAFLRMAYARELDAPPYYNLSANDRRTTQDAYNPAGQLSLVDSGILWREATRGHITYSPDFGFTIPAGSMDTYQAHNWTFAVVSAGGTQLSPTVNTIFGANPLGSDAAAADNIVSYRLVAGKKGY